MSDTGSISGPLGEFDLIQCFFVPLAGPPGALGLTDDAALFDIPVGERGVVTTDAMVAGVHFFESDAPHTVGWKLLAVNLSDLAAMGAVPLGYTLDLALPRDWSSAAIGAWAGEFTQGLKDCQVQFATSLLGGDTVSTTGPLTLAITAFGSVPKDQELRRSGARIGDLIWVSGTIGDAAMAVKMRKGWVPPAGLMNHGARRRLDAPIPRLGLGKALRGIATAAADVSDGLAADLGHICETSHVSAEVRAVDVPLSGETKAFVNADPSLISTVLTGGDDYELLFTAPPAAESAVREAAKVAQCPVHCIGRIVADGGVRIVDAEGHMIALERLGFTHF